MEDHLGGDRGHQRGESFVDDVELVEVGGVGHLGALPTREVVDHRHLSPGSDQRLGEGGADETRSAGDQCPHGAAPVTAGSTGRGTRTCSTANTMAPTMTTLP